MTPQETARDHIRNIIWSAVDQAMESWDRDAIINAATDCILGMEVLITEGKAWPVSDLDGLRATGLWTLWEVYTAPDPYALSRLKERETRREA